MKFNKFEESQIEIEKFLKAGRTTLAILSWEDRDQAITNEIVGKYDPTDGKWYIYITNPDGGGTGGGGSGSGTDPDFGSISTEADVLFDEFIHNFLEVSEIRTKNYEPSIWCMLRRDHENDSSFVNNQSVIDQFYEWIDTNYTQLKPYILHTYQNKTRDMLIPYVGTRGVFYDLGKFVENQGITNLDVVITTLYKLHCEYRASFSSILQSMSTRISNIDTNMTNINTRQDADIKMLNKMLQDSINKFNEVDSKLGNVSANSELRIRPNKFTVGGSGSMIYPVKVTINKAGLAIKGGTEAFLAGMFLTHENEFKATILQLGNISENTSPDYYNGNKDTHYVFSQIIKYTRDAKYYIYDVQRVASGSYILMLRGNNTYTLWSKYIDDITIINENREIDGFRPYEDVITDRNPILTNPVNVSNNITYTVDNSIQVTKDIIVGNRYKLSIE